MQRELVLSNASIHTMDPSQPTAEALAIRGNRILAVGSLQEMLSLCHKAERIDLAGRTVLPGFIDAHVHLSSYGLLLQQVDLGDAGSLEEALQHIQRAARAIGDDQWLLGRGWNHNVWPDPVQPTRGDLDDVVDRIPVALSSKDGHALWVNSRALQIAGVGASTPDPPGGQILRRSDGKPLGILTENAQSLIRKHIPSPSAETMDQALRAAMRDAARLGITGIHNCEGPDALAAFQRLESRGELTLRVWHMIPVDVLAQARQLGLRTGFGNDLLRIGHVKLFADGALGSGTAEMLAPYEDRPGECGVAVTTSEEMYEAVRMAVCGGLACAIHAIGDGANRRVLDIYERIAREGLSPPLSQRIEHVQLLSPQDLPRLAQLDVVASMQPIHAIHDMEMADRHWGERARWSYAWRSVLETGATLAFGTDCPVESLNPLEGLYAAITRQRPEGYPRGGWYPQERLSLNQALRAYTLGSATASGEARRKGSLTPGKLADLIVLEDDIHEHPEERLLTTSVCMTMVGGRIIYGEI
ncbi:MAG: amidohydrolase [Chloroflexota bacterium]|nr:amidohydrolase [Chloroflexota bacterium]